ncbi:hypothetical protein HW49_11205 [Porphyromonadaceae bacterium COT-184 OH4590]|nr:hypothetical protein HW49_11205 [Porphyromonadaceae bacterium COT-184 OH4590]
MKIDLYKIIFLWLSLIPLISVAQTNDGNRYATNSVLSSGQWIKISVDRRGIYKLTYDDLKSMGITPEEVRIHGYGGALLSEDFTTPYIDDLPEVPIYMNKGADGVFNAGDYILFYAQANISWQYDTKKRTFSHTRNHYSDRGYYFVTSQAGEARQIAFQNKDIQPPISTITDFLDYVYHEKDSINFAKGGREFYGEEFNQQKTSRSFNFEVPNVESRLSKMFIDLAGKSSSPSSMTININGVDVKSISLTRRYNNPYQVVELTKDTVSFTPGVTNAFKVKLTYNNVSESANLNYFEINFRRKLTVVGDEFYFRATDYIGKNSVNKFVLSNATNIEIWDITDITNITKIHTYLEGSQLTFTANTDKVREFLAINTQGSFSKPNVVGKIDNQNLHSMPQTDMVIIANKDFIPEANRLADYHRQKEEIRVNVVDAEHIFNEFSSGTPDATAYRRFTKMFYDRGKRNNDIPRWLLLFGDGVYDNRGIMGSGDESRKLLTYQAENSINTINAYTSDDYFAYLDDTDKAMVPDAQMDIAVGRMPVHTKEQAKTIVDKTISYIENNIRGEWKNRMLFIADDGDGNIHARDCDMVTEITQAQNPDILIKKLYLDAYKQETSTSTESYPMADNIFDNSIKKGVLMINFMGHGSHKGWTNEKLLTIPKITSMTNDKYPVFVTATCDFSAFDHFEHSGGEHLLWNKIGGTMALVTTTRTVYASGNADLNKYFSTNLFLKDNKDLPLTIGEILQRAKNQQTNSPNKFAFTLLGDPSIRLLYPYEAKIVTDSINYKPVDASNPESVSALSEVVVSGHIKTRYGDKIDGYDGVLSVNVFDKLETIQTLANDNGSTPFSYKDRPNPIFRGSTNIVNGRWTFKFLVPKDIKYNFGTGKIVYYASENNLGMEANGSFEDFIVGGENPNPIHDDKGPDINLFINTRDFKEGQKVNSSPLFIADLYDQSGINTAGNGIGHDIVLKRSKDDKEEVVLNDYYISNFGDYKSGTVEYQLNNLKKGRYNMWFRVWDLQNNSSSKQIAFEVSDDVIMDVSIDAYPNPATDFVTFAIQHDRPYKGLDITVRVYDIVGRTVWQSPLTKATTSNKTEVTWNFGSEGLSLNKGIYFVRVEIGVKGEQSVYKPVKLIIK